MASSLSRYREFAVRVTAEIIIIVVGVSIALWADSWMTERSGRAVEATRLNALRENITGTLAELNSGRENAEGAAGAIRNLLLLQEGERSDDEVLALLRYALLYGPDFHPEINVYEDLKNSGELALLTNTELRQLLATMDARLAFVQGSQADMATVQQINIDSYMIGRLDLQSLIGPSVIPEYNAVGAETNFGFIKDPEFRNLLIFKLDLVVELGRVYQGAENALIAVIQAIDPQLPTSAAHRDGSEQE